MEVRLEWHGDKVEAQMKANEGAALMKAAEYVRGEAVQRTPIDEGTLRGSAAVKTVDAHTVQVGFHTRYATRQHEELGWRHPKGGQAKYLESVLIENQAEIKELIAAELRRVFK